MLLPLRGNNLGEPDLCSASGKEMATYGLLYVKLHDNGPPRIAFGFTSKLLIEVRSRVQQGNRWLGNPPRSIFEKPMYVCSKT
jgi:hypothetical protein